MSADEFWKDDPQLFVSYRIFFANKKKREFEEIDYKCWLQGQYVYDGNSKLFSSLKQFLNNLVSQLFKGKKDNSKIDTYPKKPYSLLEKEKKEIKNKQLTYNEQVMVQGSIKQVYLERLKQKNKKKL